MKYQPVETRQRQWRVVVEYYPDADFSKYQWMWEVWEAGEMVDGGAGPDAEVAMTDAHQAIERTIVY